MNEFYEFEDDKKQKTKGHLGVYITLIIVSILIGGLLTYAFMPMIYNQINTSKDIGKNILTQQQAKDKIAAKEQLPIIGSKMVPLIGSINPVIDIAKKVGPSVVGVSNKIKGLNPGQGMTDQAQGEGSGIIISEDGLVITNNHVIEGSTTITVTLPGGKEVPAKLIGADQRSDLAVLKIDKSNFIVASLGDSSKVQTGELVVAIGNPLGNELAGSITVGVISAVGRSIDIGGRRLNLLQTDAAINPGNSGGALVNSRGEIIGINTIKTIFAGTDSNGVPISAEGIGFAIPINDAKPIIQELIQHGYISRPGIGVIIQKDITANESKNYGVPAGILIGAVTPSGAADKAGIKAGDILTKFNDYPIKAYIDLTDEMKKYKIGDAVSIEVWRDNKVVKVKVILSEMKK